ncbi:hypothetical protein BXO88_14075 [Oribacterium sp. C9]|nr:hypothetical protein BXO88_14075 [Oribacterium sp. C9]
MRSEGTDRHIMKMVHISSTSIFENYLLFSQVSDADSNNFIIYISIAKLCMYYSGFVSGLMRISDTQYVVCRYRL